MASWLCCCCSGREASVRPFGPQTSSEKERLTEEKECDTPEDTPGSERIMNVGLDVGSKRPSESQDDADESPTEVRAKSASGGNAPPEAAMNIEDIERLSPQTLSEKEHLTEERECDTPEDTPDSEGIKDDVGSKQPSESKDNANGSPTEVCSKSASGGNAPPEAEHEMNIEDIEGLTSQSTSTSDITLPDASELEQKQSSSDASVLEQKGPSSAERPRPPTPRSPSPPKKLKLQQTQETIIEDDEDDN